MSRFVIIFFVVLVSIGIAPLAAQQRPASSPVQSSAPVRVGITGVRSISLSEAIAEALANNPDIAVAKTTVEQATYGVAGSLGSFDPQLSVQTSTLRQVVPVSSIIGGAESGRLTQKDFLVGPRVEGLAPLFGTSYQVSFSSRRQTTDNSFTTLNPQFPTSFVASVTQPLFRGRSIDDARHRVEIAKQNQSMTDEQFRQRVMDVMLQTEQAFADLVFADQNLQIQLQGLELARQQVESNRRLVDQGVGAPIDVVEAQTQVATALQSTAAAQTQLTRAENALKVLIARDRAAAVWSNALQPTAGLVDEGSESSLEEAVKQALAQRPELVLNAISSATNEVNTRFFQNETKPRVDLLATYTSSGLAGRVISAGTNPLTFGLQPLVDRINTLSGLGGLPALPSIGGTGGGSTVPPALTGGFGQSLTNLFGQDFPTFEVGVRVSLPINDRAAKANLATSMVEARRLRLQRGQLEESIEADVRDALQAVASLRTSVAASATARDLAEQQYASEQRRFEAGTSTVFLVVQRQTALIGARSQHARVQADLDKSLAILRRVTGRTLEAHRISVSPD